MLLFLLKRAEESVKINIIQLSFTQKEGKMNWIKEENYAERMRA